MKRSSSGVIAGVVAALACAAPALAGPANVTVRVEGEAATLVERSAVTTDTVDVLVQGADKCPGTTAGGALYKSVAGDLGGTWGPYGFELKRVKQEIQTAASGADPARYWSFWVNYSYQNQGLCATELQEGDDVLVFADCFSSTQQCESLSPLRISGIPATIDPGRPVTVKVEEFVVEYDRNFVGTTKAEPAEGTTIVAAGQTATTAADGTAQLTFGAAGPVSIAATKAGRVRTAALACVTNGADGSCGTQLPPNVVVGTEPPKPDTTPPVAAFTSALADGRVFSRRRAPRELSGSVAPDPSGLTSVRLSITRSHGDRCWTFRGETERFKRHTCGGAWYFKLGDRADWSYLLPRRLPAGRYTIGVMATDKAFNASRTEVEIRVK